MKTLENRLMQAEKAASPDQRYIDTLTRLTANKEKFAIVSDPSNPKNWGIIWEDSGTEAGFFNEVTARWSALLQDGMEADPEESQTWVW